MKRYRLWYTLDGDMMEDPHGDYVEYEGLLDIAERLEMIPLEIILARPIFVYEVLIKIINEIRSEQ